MITIHIDTTSDGHTLAHCYEGVENNIVLVNPTRNEVIKTLKENPTDVVMCLGHGCSYGLFGAKGGMAIDGTMVNLLKDREMIGIWCHAKDFGKLYRLKGFFTSMFISNPGEAACYQMQPINEEVTQSENIFFADRVCDLIKKNVPLNEWVDILRTDYHTEYDFSNFNMDGLEYLDGTQTLDNAYTASIGNYAYNRSLSRIMGDMVCKTDDIRELINELRFKIGLEDYIEYDGQIITNETLNNWEGYLDEIESYLW